MVCGVWFVVGRDKGRVFIVAAFTFSVNSIEFTDVDSKQNTLLFVAPRPSHHYITDRLYGIEP